MEGLAVSLVIIGFCVIANWEKIRDDFNK